MPLRRPSLFFVGEPSPLAPTTFALIKIGQIKVNYIKVLNAYWFNFDCKSIMNKKSFVG